MKKLWKLEWKIEGVAIGGLFVATDEEVQAIVGKEVCFSDEVGDFSGLKGTVKDEEITFVSDSLIVIESVEKYHSNFFAFPETDN